ncbi:ead/Ea22-like family protein [Klebsiella quasipneumoniae]|uniref:ead/Ea22-like family protein n=1 Tax=Klebsiella quasipneumoniae TaxID=1463165 RepID=UPI001D12FBB1|nr:ead/Ea22-like family protein [Klebsiella quasipneumoniae]
MTITLQAVNELIVSLESAGEPSIREQKFLKLAKAFKQLAAENVALKQSERELDKTCSEEFGQDWVSEFTETPATDAYLAGIKADGRVEGAHFVANRMLAAWDAGFIEDTAKNAADIARMILTSTEFMADAPEGDFDRSFADGILEDIAKQLREGADK